MQQYTEKQIQDTLKIIDSSIMNCEKVRAKLNEVLPHFHLIPTELKHYIFQRQYYQIK